MNTRICSVIASVTLLALSLGCGGTRNFLFGRGARCGPCARLSNPIRTPLFGNRTQAPYAQTPWAPGYVAPQRQIPPYQRGVVTAPANGWGRGNAGNVYGGHGYAGSCCGTCGDYGATCGGDCGCGGGWNHGCGGCGGVVDDCGQVVSDPYLQGGISGGTMPYNGQIISDSEQVIGGQGYPGSIAPIQSDNFNARKFDSDGNRILWEEPLSQGTTSL